MVCANGKVHTSMWVFTNGLEMRTMVDRLHCGPHTIETSTVKDERYIEWNEREKTKMDRLFEKRTKAKQQ